MFQIEKKLLPKEHAENFKDQVGEVINLVKEKPEEAFALAKSRQTEAQNSDQTPATSPVVHRKSSIPATSSTVPAGNAGTSAPVKPAEVTSLIDSVIVALYYM